MQKLTTCCEKLDLCLKPAVKQMLYDADTVAQSSVCDFVLESTLARAEETLTDRRHFGLNAEQWDAFMIALDAPPRELSRIKRLFSEPGIFEDACKR